MPGSHDQSLSSTAPMPALAPASAAPAERMSLPRALERIEVLDILRGIALIGMFLVHFNYYEATPPGVEPGRLAHFIEQFLGVFIEERFYAMFAMLFGVGFAVQLTRAEARGEPFVGRYLRRLAALAVFGFIAEGVFGYNVLLGYAMWGVPLLLVRKWPVKALLVLLVLCAGSRQIYSVGRIVAASRQPNGIAEYKAGNQARMAKFMAGRDSLRAAEQSPSWKTVVAARVRFMPRFHWQWNRFPNSSFILFLLGMIGWKLGLFTRPEARKRLIVSLMVFGAASSALVMFAFPLGGPVPPQPNPDSPVWSSIAALARNTGFGLVRPELLAFAYIGIVLLLVAHNRAWLQRLSFFGWAGKMALTNYMMQVMILDVFGSPKGFGIKLPALLVFPSAIALFVAQVYMSRWWLSHFRLGPLEWVWRSITYRKVQPLRIERAPFAPRLAMEVGD